MPLSGTEITRIGIIGFPGKAYAGFTAKAESEIIEYIFGTLSMMNVTGSGITSTMEALGDGITSTMTASHGTLSIMNTTGDGVTSTIDANGDGITSEM